MQQSLRERDDVTVSAVRAELDIATPKLTIPSSYCTWKKQPSLSLLQKKFLFFLRYVLIGRDDVFIRDGFEFTSSDLHLRVSW